MGSPTALVTTEVVASPGQAAYFSLLESETKRVLSIAEAARREGWDPTTRVEIVLAEDLAARVEAQTELPGVAQMVRDLTARLGDRELVALESAKRVARGELKAFPGPAEAIDKAVRVGLSVLTEGVLVAPLEGIAKAAIGRNADGTDYVDLFFAGPIRAAGGTAQALSVLLADVVRRDLGIGRFQPTVAEIQRFQEEIPAYKRAQHLQYVPESDEIELIVKHCPISINGEGTERVEVTGHRDLPRVETNQLRGGACLVIAEGLTQKAAKVLKHVNKLGLGEEWKFLEKFVKKKSSSAPDDDAFHEIEASDKFIRELIGGRPVFAHPSRPGGFRLRYGRGRTCGIAATAIHPVVMHAVDDFLAIGTQMKLERPGKGTIVTPCEALEGPLLLLDDGELRRVQTLEEYRQVQGRVRRITDLGEILIPFGEFAENNAILADPTFTTEWWGELVRARAGDAVADQLLLEPRPSFERAVEWSRTHDVPLHPALTFLWHDVTVEQCVAFRDRLREQGRMTPEGVAWPASQPDQEFLVALALPHRQQEGKLLVGAEAPALLACLGLRADETGLLPAPESAAPLPPRARFPALAWAERNVGVPLKARAPTRVGARMGRPEKADVRKMDPTVHGLFPTADGGGLKRDLLVAAKAKGVTAEVARRRCDDCQREGPWPRCVCGGHTHETGAPPDERPVMLGNELQLALKRLQVGAPDEVKGVMGLMSKSKTPEMVAKGILRAIHEVYVFKDGTIRFDATDAPLTHFRPAEIGTPIARLLELGYTHDVKGAPLESPHQLLELRVQDVIPPRAAGTYFVRVAKFLDQLLEKMYGLDPFYRVGRASDLVGHLVAGLAPHTSAAVLGRIIGFTDAQVCWAHPFFHTGKRRNCAAGETEVFLFNSPRPTRLDLRTLYEATKSAERVVDEAGTQAKDLSGVQVLAVDPSTGRVERKRAAKVYRVPSPRHLLELRTASGRNIKCSPDHRMPVGRDGRLEKVKAVSLNHGDAIFFAGRLDLAPERRPFLDLFEEFNADPPDGLCVRRLGQWLHAQVRALGGLADAARACGITRKGLDNFRRRDRLPWHVFQRMLKARGMGFGRVPRVATLAVARDTVEVPRIIPIDASLMRLLGYYLAEGHSRGKPGRWFQVSIAAQEPEMVRGIRAAAKAVFGRAPIFNGRSLTISSRVVHHLFTRIWGLGSRAQDKRIPGRFAAMPPRLTRELLAAYFSGDGSVEAGRLHVSCTSVSRGLLRDIGLQLAARGIAFRIRSERRPAGGAVRAFLLRKQRPIRSYVSHRMSIRSSHAVHFGKEIGFLLRRKQRALEDSLPFETRPHFRAGPGDLIEDKIVSIRTIRARDPYVYDLEVDDFHNYLANDFLLTSNCDGDEDALMLLMDAFLNFSKTFIPDRRGGLMDLPLVLSMRIDPREIDKEAQNLDTLWKYPLAFYEAAERHAPAKELAAVMGLVEKRLGRPEMYEGFGFTLDTPTIQAGPRESSYKSLGTMLEKMERQLKLADRIRAVDAGDVAGRVLSTHLLPDILGNLKAFARQQLRCTKCNSKYRRVPLAGLCTKQGKDGKSCGNALTLTVPQAGVRKYLELSVDIADRFPISEYTKERVRLAQQFVDASFAPEKFRTMRLGEFS